MGKQERSRPDALERALHHPLRMRLLDLMLAGAPASPRVLAEETGEPLSRVSYHLSVLAECGGGKPPPGGESRERGAP